ncbi:hypothetical protein HK099_004540 [Clydaea vesicula]|uniref:Rap-GAP domain-containing protein n=1 Tax=Clydaea vesicula TaxID=447962 RepID=A0AAD5XVJ9_9FUNG|nr:hypothetical protein HK099_004540 [Clydaea vesicula]KAJ3378674.1 hypothetical protein HDU92_007246 [Lobulomyces angularis]
MSVVLGNSDFKIEAPVQNAKITGVQESLLQESEKDIIWYRDNFFGKGTYYPDIFVTNCLATTLNIYLAHMNFLATDSPRGPMAISLIDDADNTYKALIRATQGSERLSVSSTAVTTSWWRSLFGLKPLPEDIFAALSRNIPSHNLKLCKDPNLPNELLQMEERQVIRSYKFGVCYLAGGQDTEEQMMGNKMETVSPAFKQFLNFLGETIELKGWKSYRAGLDVTNNNTGTHSVYTKWQGYEIMYHVSTMLPYNPNDRQQLERKRHIGNDIVVIVFQDDANTPIQLQSIVSHQNHVIVVVTPHGDLYRIVVLAKNGVPVFTPELPEPCLITKEAVGRDFFLHKLVNGERASYKAPSFASKISRTRTVLLFETATKGLGS